MKLNYNLTFVEIKKGKERGADNSNVKSARLLFFIRVANGSFIELYNMCDQTNLSRNI